MSVYTEAELRRLISLAKKLGLDDDVKHWQNELDKIQEKGSQNG